MCRGGSHVAIAVTGPHVLIDSQGAQDKASDGSLCWTRSSSSGQITERQARHVVARVVSDVFKLPSTQAVLGVTSIGRSPGCRAEVSGLVLVPGQALAREVANDDPGQPVDSTGRESDLRRRDVFSAPYVPSLSLAAYKSRIHGHILESYGTAKPGIDTDDLATLSLLYIDRLLNLNPEVKLSPLNAHMLLLTSTVIAVKFHDDACYRNTYYAYVGGISVADLNALEMRFLKMLDWRLHVTHEEYSAFHLKRLQDRSCLSSIEKSKLFAYNGVLGGA